MIVLHLFIYFSTQFHSQSTQDSKKRVSIYAFLIGFTLTFKHLKTFIVHLYIYVGGVIILGNSLMLINNA